MKIDHTLGAAGLGEVGGAANRETAKTGQAKLALNRYGKADAREAEAGSSDRVELSSVGQQLREIASGGPEQDKRIEELAALVASGGYHPDSAAIGEKLIDEAISESGDPGGAK